MSTQWSDKKVAFHQEWSRAMEGRYYMRGDKKKWFALEQHFLAAELKGDPAMDYYLDCARKFCEETTNGYAEWLNKRA